MAALRRARRRPRRLLVSHPDRFAERGSVDAGHGGPTIDETKLVTLAGNTRPEANAENDRGLVLGALRVEHMQLVLRRSPEREAALDAFIDALHDKTSPVYQQWLTAVEFGQQYGVPQTEIDTVTAWLTSHGLGVDSVPVSHMFIEFSGTAEQIHEAFHTEIHELEVDGVRHIGNITDPAIPATLARTVVGVHALHDFMPHPMHKERGAVRRDRTSGAWSNAGPSPSDTFPFGAQCTVNSDCASNSCNTATGICHCTTSTQCKATLSGAAASCNTTTQSCVQCATNADCVGPATCNTATSACVQTFLAVTPADFATIYDESPLFAEGITGAGQTVVVIEDTLLKNTSDPATFRAAFGLSGYAGTFAQYTVTGSTACANAGVNAAESEAVLDAEWAGATAPGAHIVLAACADSATVFGGLIALENLLNGASPVIPGANPPPVVSISYGECEASNGAAANASFVNVYQQAATAGVSVFVASGDEGAASCDANKTVATHGIAVSGFGSTPYNVAVGGTDFADYYASQNGGPAVSSYWSATNTASFGSALSYIPEAPWDDSCASSLLYATPAIALGSFTQAYGAAGFCNATVGKTFFRTTGAGSGGPSTFSTQPTWQTGVFGLPTKSGGARYMPDVSLFAADGVFGHFLLYCLTDTAQGGGPCTYTNADDSLVLAAGGTSFASPSMAGIQALIDQKMGSAQGNPNYTYYKLAAAEAGARGSARCNSSRGQPDPSCIFHDVALGSIVVNCTGNDCFGASGMGAAAVDGVLSVSNTTDTPAYAAGIGWDYATGLGTVDAYNLVTAWSE